MACLEMSQLYLNTSENIDDNTTDYFASENSIYVFVRSLCNESLKFI